MQAALWMPAASGQSWVCRCQRKVTQGQTHKGCPFCQKFSGEASRPANTVLKMVNNHFRKGIGKARGRLDNVFLQVPAECVSGFQPYSAGGRKFALLDMSFVSSLGLFAGWFVPLIH